MTPLRQVLYVSEIPVEGEFLFVGDIGGTNSNFGVFQSYEQKLTLILSVHALSQEVTDFGLLVHQVLSLLAEKYNLSFKDACFALAGVMPCLGNDYTFTNLRFDIDIEALKLATGLQAVVFCNDFEVVAYGVDLIKQEDIIPIQKGIACQKTTRVFIGAGTGLGKCIDFWSPSYNRYDTLPSEGGHGDFACHTPEDMALHTFIQRQKQAHLDGENHTISWEDVLSGKGIRSIYAFVALSYRFAKTACDYEIEDSGFEPDFISRYRLKSERCRYTFDMYAKFYGRCAKNFALDALARSGLYISGGIAAKNLEVFQQKEFIAEFADSAKKAELLKAIPVYVIADYNVSLYGAASYLLFHRSRQF